MIEEHITFTSDDGKELLLQGVHYDVLINGLMAKTAIEQKYTNPYKTNIEAIYTFPLAPDAVLLGVEIKINERLLKGTIIEKSEAEEQYEQAIDDGNRAIMVEKSSDGIYTVNIANLLPEDSITVIIEYTQLLQWRQDQVKYSIPTTIAPKYGNASDLGLDDTSDPAISLFAENLFDFNMRIRGTLADSSINAPSHTIDITRNKNDTSIRLKNDVSFMDKDIVFTFKTNKSREERSFALIGKDIDGYATIASFYPSFGSDLPKQPKSVTFVVDCSGSMMGVSIEKARVALNKALDLFDKEDSFNIIKFGSHHTTLFDNEVLATPENISIAKKMLRTLQADMGGTEMASALISAYNGHSSKYKNNSYLFLITDGQIYDHSKVINDAKKSEMAHYIVGVGYGTDDALLSKIANETRGSFENIDPNEKMDDYILNIFKKIDTPKALDVKVFWPQRAKLLHTPNIVFDGDTLYAFATFDTLPIGEINLTYSLENGNQYSTTLVIDENTRLEKQEPSTVAKLVMSQEMQQLQNTLNQSNLLTEHSYNTQIIELSKAYQLFSQHTNYILVDKTTENEKPLSIPSTHKVENMMLEQACYSVSTSYNAPTMMKISKSISSRDRVQYALSEAMESPSKSEDDLINRSINSFKSIFGSNSESASYQTERYLLILNDVFMDKGYIPTETDEIIALVLDPSLARRLYHLNTVENITAYIKKLYEACSDTSILDQEFIDFIEAL